MNLYDILNTKIILCKLLNNNTLPKNITSKDLLNIQLEPYLINDQKIKQEQTINKKINFKDITKKKKINFKKIKNMETKLLDMNIDELYKILKKNIFII